MYYTTYRPQTLAELDNVAVREKLEKILKAPHMPHAFLFAGPKGTGKTSTARILAKELNGPENAQAIAKGTSPDVIELDAASHRKIDDIREIISELKFSPLVSKYKIYIIDEVHMLTKESFNALLKSLEEPPASTLFILATTEADNLPATIRSRCMIVPFTLATHTDIMSMLNRICAGESLNLPQDMLEWIARHADGSFRDAAKLLDTAVVQGATTLEALISVAGHQGQRDDLLLILQNKNTKKALEWIQASAQSGAQFKGILEELLTKLHAHLLRRNGIEVPVQTEYTFSIKECAKLMSMLQQAYNEMKFAPIQHIPLELAVIDFLDDQTRA